MSGLNIGATLQSGKYEIIKLLGQGGFGITYLARHTMLGTNFALKEFFPQDYCNRDGSTSHVSVATQSNVELVKRLRDRFIKEAQNMARLKHPGVIQIHDVFEENGTAYYVMDFVEGSSLDDMVRLQGPMPEKKGVEYARRIGDALDYIHANKITHFDVKPANVMVREKDGEPILIDFGLSKQYNDTGHARSTLLMGVSHGFSPLEQYMQDGIDTFSPPTDVYALGATLYYLLTGRVPPEALKLTAAPIEVPVNISKRTADAIKWAMAPHRENRCPSARAFIDALDPTKGATQFAAQKPSYNARPNPQTQFVAPPGNVPPVSTATPAPKKNVSLKIVALSFLVLVIILFVVIMLIRDDSKSDSGPVTEESYAISVEEAATDSIAAAEKVAETPAKSSFYGICGFVAENGYASTRNGKTAYYYKGDFSLNSQKFPVMLCFVDNGGSMQVVYKNVAYNVPPMDMEIISDGEGELRLENAKNGFSMNLWEGGGDTLSGEAMQGNNKLSVSLSPTCDTF